MAEQPVRTHDARVQALRRVGCWAPVFGGVDAHMLADFDLVVVDGVAHSDGEADTTAAEVRDLQRHGVVVLSYLSVGSVEDWRHYPADVPRSWTLGPVEGWEGERYADARQEGWRRLMTEEARRLQAAGFDGLYLDNLDVGADYPHTQDGLVRLVEGLRAAAPDLLLVAQNGLVVAERLPIDGIAHEDVFWRWEDGYRASTRSEVAPVIKGLRRLRDRGLTVLTLDYTEPGGPGAKEALQRSQAEGFHPSVTVLELDRLPHTTPNCRSGRSV